MRVCRMRHHLITCAAPLSPPPPPQVGHKFGAPKGVAALYVRSGVQLERLLHGGGQESGQRAGTGAACDGGWLGGRRVGA